MRPTPLITLLALIGPIPSYAQTGEEQIVAVAEALFDAMRSKDAELIRRLMLPEARLVAVDATAGAPAVTWSGLEQFIERVTGSSEELLERMWSPAVEIDGAIATLWTPYDFHRDATFSHCGSDAFHMIRVGEEWKIAHVTYNRRTTGCYSPLGKLGMGSRE